jgi:hypothetical protein
VSRPDPHPNDDDPTAASRGAGDPVLARRRQVARMVSLGQRVGYTLFAGFVVLFIIAFITHFPSVVVTAATVCLIAGSVVLAPAMVFAYAVKAADREDRQGDWR